MIEMASISFILAVIAASLMFMCCFLPLVVKLFVINSIEKRYNCKLNIDIENRKFLPLYSYFKYAYPAAAIAMAYLFNSKKMINTYPGLNKISYDIKKAPRIEIFVCVSCWCLAGMTLFFMILFGVMTQIFNIK